jgi:hypothetical protein
MRGIKGHRKYQPTKPLDGGLSRQRLRRAASDDDRWTCRPMSRGRRRPQRQPAARARRMTRRQKSSMFNVRHYPEPPVLAELGHSQIQNRPLLNGTIPGQADWTRLRPQCRARRPRRGELPLPPSGVLNYIGLSGPPSLGPFLLKIYALSS